MVRRRSCACLRRCCNGASASPNETLDSLAALERRQKSGGRPEVAGARSVRRTDRGAFSHGPTSARGPGIRRPAGRCSAHLGRCGEGRLRQSGVGGRDRIGQLAKEEANAGRPSHPSVRLRSRWRPAAPAPSSPWDGQGHRHRKAARGAARISTTRSTSSRFDGWIGAGALRQRLKQNPGHPHRPRRLAGDLEKGRASRPRSRATKT
jgi:hypothetical protein